jgi:hypothetical protein
VRFVGSIMVARLAAALVLLIHHGGVDGCSRLQSPVAVCRRCHGGTTGNGFVLSLPAASLLALVMRRATSSAMVVWLVAPTVSCAAACGDDVGENSSPLGTTSIALLVSLPS